MARLAVMGSGPARVIILHMAVRTAWMGEHLMNRIPLGKPGFDVDHSLGRWLIRADHILRERRHPEAERHAHDKGWQECVVSSHAKRTSRDKGRERTRWPVSANTALASAGAAGGVPISPTPPIRA
jgi:hypothetical protein